MRRHVRGALLALWLGGAGFSLQRGLQSPPAALICEQPGLKPRLQAEACSITLQPQLAYVGPGAGFAFLGSFLSLLAGFFLSVASLLAWPFRMAWRLVRRQEGFRNAKVKKVSFLGQDGLDPK